MEEEKLQKKGIVHELKPSEKAVINAKKNLLTTIIIVALLGVGTGYVANMVSASAKKGPVSVSGGSASDSSKKGTIVGVDDAKAFPDTAEGELTAGGINGEGEFHLVRPGGDSQNVYMTSSIIDLSQFVGKKVKVWGQTQKAKTAGWLMDVGKLEVQ